MRKTIQENVRPQRVNVHSGQVFGERRRPPAAFGVSPKASGFGEVSLDSLFTGLVPVNREKDGFGGTPKPPRETHGLPFFVGFGAPPAALIDPL